MPKSTLFLALRGAGRLAIEALVSDWMTPMSCESRKEEVAD